MSISLGNSSRQVSLHGQQILNELVEPIRGVAREAQILEWIGKDKLCAKLKSKEVGNTAYHYIMDLRYSDEFVLKMLKALYASCPDGIKISNNFNQYPLHFALQRKGSLDFEMIKILADAHPAAIGAVPTTTGTPCFHTYIKRVDMIDVDVCRILLDNYPEAIKMLDKDRNLPIHSSCNKSPYAEYAGSYTASHPSNVELIKLLVQRHPEGAQEMNKYYQYPLHLICMNCDNIDTVKMVYGAHPEAIQICDAYARSCLHLATLAVGKCQTKAVSDEETELSRIADLHLAAKNKNKGKKGGNKEEYSEAHTKSKDKEQVDYDEDDLGIWEEPTESSYSQGNVLKDDYGVNRDIVRWLIDMHPPALLYMNNFHSTPVETVLEKTKALKTKVKHVMVFGLYDDPPTARILLLAHRRYASIKSENGTSAVADLKPRYILPFHELNYVARRDALLISMVAISRPFMSGATSTTTNTSSLTHSPRSSMKSEPENGESQSKEISKAKQKKKFSKSGNVQKKSAKKSSAEEAQGEYELTKDNILGRLRQEGFIDTVKIIIEYL